MKLHENISLYTDAIRFTAQQMNLPPEYVEKDYWVTFALYNIFKNEIGKEVRVCFDRWWCDNRFPCNRDTSGD